MQLIGVDGCPAGWVVAESHLAADGARPLAAPQFRIARTFSELLASLTEAEAIIGVDIPIGLAGGAPDADGDRLADQAARRFVGGRRAASVFSAPCRRTLTVGDYAAACASEQAARGKMLSRQAFGILPKIREVDAAISPAHQLPPGPTDGESAGVRVREVHPEVTFAVLCGDGEAGHGLKDAKRTPSGEAERLALLRPFVGDVDVPGTRGDLHLRHRAQAPGTGLGRIVGRDDIVDALACLVTAYRIVTGRARTLPEDVVQKDARGLRMEIVA